MSGPGYATVIRVGKPKYHYVYTYMGNGTYKCERGSDYCDINEVLWMRKEHDDLWYAFDAPDYSPFSPPTFVEHDKVIFKSADADVHIPGWHTWTLMKTSNHDQGSFQTTLIAD